MAWKRLNTSAILSVKYYPAKQRLKAHLRAGFTEVYGEIPEAKYQELVSIDHPGDVDTFLANMIRPYMLSRRPTFRYRAYRAARVLLVVALMIGSLILLGLWNSGWLSSYLQNAYWVRA